MLRESLAAHLIGMAHSGTRERRQKDKDTTKKHEIIWKMTIYKTAAWWRRCKEKENVDHGLPKLLGIRLFPYKTQS